MAQIITWYYKLIDKESIKRLCLDIVLWHLDHHLDLQPGMKWNIRVYHRPYNYYGRIQTLISRPHQAGGEFKHYSTTELSLHPQSEVDWWTAKSHQRCTDFGGYTVPAWSRWICHEVAFSTKLNFGNSSRCCCDLYKPYHRKSGADNFIQSRNWSEFYFIRRSSVIANSNFCGLTLHV